MMVTPVVFTAMVCAVLSVTDAKKMRKITIQAILVYAISMAVAVTIGLSLAILIAPGAHFHPMLGQVHVTAKAPTFTHMIANIIPRSPIGALASEQILQIVVFALILGVSIKLAKEKAQPVVDFFNVFSAVVFKLAGIIIAFAPYDIFALIAWTFGNFGLHAILPLAKFVSTVYVGCVLQIIFVYTLALLLVARLNPLTFFKGIAAAIAFAFTTSIGRAD